MFAKLKQSLSSNLTAGQQAALDAMLNGQNVFLTGDAGTGKSFVLQEFLNKVSRRKNVICCAPTGIAALRLKNGSTIHRAFRLPFLQAYDYHKHIHPTDEILNADIIVIDEISMCRVDLFDYIAEVIFEANDKTGYERQVIVVGDLNSYYCRDQIKAKFIDAIAESGKGVAKDVWVELEKKGEYPAPKDGIICCETDGNILDGEVLDKIIYINPTSGTNIKPLSYSLDQEGYKRDGKMLGDHFPLAATFMVDDGKSTGIHALDDENDAVKVVYYNLNGQRIDYPAKGIYVESKGKDTRKRIIK